MAKMRKHRLEDKNINVIINGCLPHLLNKQDVINSASD